MTNRLSFHIFTEFGGPGGSYGLWRHPEMVPPQGAVDLQGWIDIAKLAENNGIDSLFFADSVGMGGQKPGDLDAELRSGRYLLLDPSILVGVLSQVTENLGFLFTSSILQDHPFTFARRMSTLDHVSDGRVGWNIVTSYSPNAAKNMGLDDLPAREERYKWAAEYTDVAYRLWEGSWEDDALVEDVESGDYVDPSKVHRLDYAGERYRVQGPHMVHASPQRTPLLVQAGASRPGQEFAANNAELVFLPANRVEVMEQNITHMRDVAEAAGRRRDDLKFITSAHFIVGSTSEKARRAAEEFDAKVNFTELADNLSESTGIDLSGVDLDTPTDELDFEHATGMQGVVDSLRERLPTDRRPTVRDILVAGLQWGRVVGSPEEIADTLESWQRAGVDGIAIWMRLRPTSLTDFIEHVAPVLRERGLMQMDYQPGTLREKVMGEDPRLPERHRAARHRRYADDGCVL